FNILLQLLDEGRLTDAHGRTVNFKNTVVIMTSNVGARDITQGRDIGGFRGSEPRQERQTERAYESMRHRVMDELKRTFRPEFLNRVDDVIVFHQLSHEEIKQIVDLMLAQVNKQLTAQGMALVCTEEVKDHLAQEGFDIAYGARPLRRAVQRMIEDPLSEEVLLGRFSDGDAIRAELVDGKIIFRKAEVPKELSDADLPALPAG
ncbi:MAG: ATP-dependent Clp protease ATP-binding subunit, partial [Armatimonadetes bacterium]|nr:ATP-dependent Clp protease ATP-binding subunit [Armatimonadota bacterium]